MKKPSDRVAEREELREQLIGLGESSLRKSYYPELQKQLANLEERVLLAELVADIGQGLTEEVDLHRSLQRCSDVLVQRTDAAFVRIWVLEDDGDTLTLQASSGLHTAREGRHSRISISDYPFKVGAIARDKRPLLTNEVANSPQFHDQDWVKRQGIVAFAGYPLLLQQKLVGVIALFAQQELKETMLDTLSTIVNQIAVSIERVNAIDAYKRALENARLSHEKVNGILRSVADALLVIDNDRRIVHMNQAAEKLLGISLATAFRRPLGEVSSETALLDYLEQVEQVAGSDEDIDLEMFDRARGARCIIQARCAQLTGAHSGSGLVISLRDVTQNRELQRLKSEFITTAAHELRTPLTTIMGFAELLASQEWDSAIRQEYLGYILDKADRLEQIIDDLLDLSRIESGRGLALNCAVWPLGTTLEKIVARCRVEHPDYDFTEQIGADLGLIHADQGKVLQAIDNLLSNAIKYSPPGSTIVFSAQADDDTLTVSVADQGIGMDAEQVKKCFEKFYRADASDTAIGGLGLGMSIARQIIDAHNGRIWIESTPGQGTTVSFTLPIVAV